MAQTSDHLDSLIEQLAASDAQRRESAARELFRLGCAAAEPVLAGWFADPEFRALAGKGSSLLTVGIAVQPQRFRAIHAASGKPRLAAVPPDQEAEEFTLSFAHGVRLDILTTRDPAGSGALARFLSRFGEGIQQIECDLSDVDRATAILRQSFGLQPLYPETRAGADGTRVNFFLVPVASAAAISTRVASSPVASSPLGSIERAAPDPNAPAGRKVLIEIVEVAAARPAKR